MSGLAELFGDLHSLTTTEGSKEYFREGTVVKIDLTGDEPSNFNRVAPAVQVDVAGQGSGEFDRVPFWLRLLTDKQDTGGNIYFPPDEGARVLIACPGGYLHQGIVIGCLKKPPVSAGTTTAERAKHGIMEFGDLTILMNRQEGEEEYTITIPGSASGQHLLTLRRKIDSRGIVMQTAGGHTLTLQDLESDKKVELSHSSGSRITFEKDGSFTVIVKGDLTTVLDGDRATTVGGDDTLGVDGDQEVTVAGTVDYTAGGALTINGLSIDANSNTTINLRTLGLLAGVVTGLTQPFCNYNGAPLGCSLTVKADV